MSTSPVISVLFRLPRWEHVSQISHLVSLACCLNSKIDSRKLQIVRAFISVEHVSVVEANCLSWSSLFDYNPLSLAFCCLLMSCLSLLGIDRLLRYRRYILCYHCRQLVCEGAWHTYYIWALLILTIRSRLCCCLLVSCVREKLRRLFDQSSAYEWCWIRV